MSSREEDKEVESVYNPLISSIPHTPSTVQPTHKQTPPPIRSPTPQTSPSKPSPRCPPCRSKCIPSSLRQFSAKLLPIPYPATAVPRIPSEAGVQCSFREGCARRASRRMGGPGGEVVVGGFVSPIIIAGDRILDRNECVYRNESKVVELTEMVKLKERLR